MRNNGAAWFQDGRRLFFVLKPIATFFDEKKVNAYTLRQYLDRIQRSVRECRL